MSKAESQWLQAYKYANRNISLKIDKSLNYKYRDIRLYHYNTKYLDNYVYLCGCTYIYIYIYVYVYVYTRMYRERKTEKESERQRERERGLIISIGLAYRFCSDPKTLLGGSWDLVSKVISGL